MPADPIPLSNSIYAWVLGVALGLSIPFVLAIRQCNAALRSEIKKDIESAAKMPRDSEFYLSMFHLSRRYHDHNWKIKVTCGSFLGIVMFSLLGVAYDQRWYAFEEVYAKAVLILLGIVFSVNFVPLSWQFIRCYEK